MTIITIPIPSGPIGREDEHGDIIITREWYKYFALLVKALGNSTTHVTDTAFAQSQVSTTNALLGKIHAVEHLALLGLVRSSSSTPFASTTEQLTGTAANKASTPDSVAALWEKGADIASAGTISIGEGGYHHITGNTTITDIDFGTDKSGRGVWLIFDAALILTHNATSLILPTGANIATEAGDAAWIVSEDGSNNVRVPVYFRKSGKPVNVPIYAPLTTGELAGGTDPTFVVTAAGEVIMAELV